MEYIKKNPLHFGNYFELEKTYQASLNKFQFQIVLLQLAAVAF